MVSTASAISQKPETIAYRCECGAVTIVAAALENCPICHSIELTQQPVPESGAASNPTSVVDKIASEAADRLMRLDLSDLFAEADRAKAITDSGCHYRVSCDLSSELKYAQMSANQLASALGVDRKVVRRWCQEKAIPSKWFHEATDVIHRFAMSGELRERKEVLTRRGDNRAERDLSILASLVDAGGLQYIRERNRSVAEQMRTSAHKG